MPWLETSPVEQRERFIRDHRLELYSMVELCTRYGISRKTGYKWFDRFEDCPARFARTSRRHQRWNHPPEKAAAVIANALKQHPIGLEEVDDGIWSIHFCNVLLGRVDERDYTIRA